MSTIFRFLMHIFACLTGLVWLRHIGSSKVFFPGTRCECIKFDLDSTLAVRCMKNQRDILTYVVSFQNSSFVFGG